MKLFLGSLIAVSILAEALSLTCYRCGGAAASGFCSSNNSATVTCENSGLPADTVYGCQVYTVNYTTLDRVLEFKGCCIYEDCNKNPCIQFGEGTVCSMMTSCQSDKCNKDYATAKASPRPTLPAPSSKTCKLFLSNLLVTPLAVVVVFCLHI